MASHMGRSPYGERGLKFVILPVCRHALGSLSLRRAWIEMPKRCSDKAMWLSLSLRRAWIEIMK